MNTNHNFIFTKTINAFAINNENFFHEGHLVNIDTFNKTSYDHYTINHVNLASCSVLIKKDEDSIFLPFEEIKQISFA